MFGHITGFDRDFFDQFERMQRQVAELFGEQNAPLGIRSVAAGSFPAINIGASPKQVDVYAFAAGVDPQNLDISVLKNILTIAGERTNDIPENAQTYRRERFHGNFKRVITLPEDVDPDKVNANYRNGVLHITIQRKEELQARKIAVK